MQNVIELRIIILNDQNDLKVFCNAQYINQNKHFPRSIRI